jgi:DNA-directed RNA polymerase II subunit RPB4
MSRQDPTSRAKPKPEGDEEATSVLNLGEFQNVDALSLSEASIIINAVLAKRKKEGRNMKQNEYAWHSLSASERLPCERRDRLTRRKIAYYPNLTYLDTFARFKKKENIEAVERLLNGHPELAKFEKAQLGTYVIFRSCLLFSHVY